MKVDSRLHSSLYGNRYWTNHSPGRFPISILSKSIINYIISGATEINLVVHGKYTILDMGDINPEIVVAIAALIIVAASLHYHIKG